MNTEWYTLNVKGEIGVYKRSLFFISLSFMLFYFRFCVASVCYKGLGSPVFLKSNTTRLFIWIIDTCFKALLALQSLIKKMLCPECSQVSSRLDKRVSRWMPLCHTPLHVGAPCCWVCEVWVLCKWWSCWAAGTGACACQAEDSCQNQHKE